MYLPMSVAHSLRRCSQPSSAAKATAAVYSLILPLMPGVAIWRV